MDRHEKRKWGTIAAVATIVSAIVGIMSNLPNAIANAMKDGPWLLQQPNFWWCGILLAIGAATVWWIWKQPDPASADPVIGFLLEQLEIFSEQFARHKNNAVDGPEVVHRFVYQMIPTYLEKAVGANERREFEKAIAAAREKWPKDPLFAYQASIAWITAFIHKRTEELIGKKLKRKGMSDSDVNLDVVESP